MVRHTRAGGIGRATLPAILQRHATAAGAHIRMGVPARLADVSGADLVLAADGVASETRSALGAELGVAVSHGELDITRPNAGEHLGFGWGVHGCAGQGLARMEAHALLTALAEQIDRIDLTAPATAVLNNLINARASVPVTVTPARTTGTGPGGGPGYAGAGG